MNPCIKPLTRQLALVVSILVLAALMPSQAMGAEVNEVEPAMRTMEQSSLTVEEQAEISELPAINITSDAHFSLEDNTVAIVTEGDLTGTVIILESLNSYEGRATVRVLQAFEMDIQQTMEVGDTIDLEEGTLALLDVTSEAAVFVISTAYSPEVQVIVQPSEQNVDVGTMTVFDVSVVDLRNASLEAGEATYAIVIRGLPDGVWYTTESNAVLEPNESTQFSLSVNVTDDELAGSSMVLAVEAHGTNSSARDEAMLVVNPQPSPYAAVEIELAEGWNLVSLPGRLVSFEEPQPPDAELTAFVYLTSTKQYETIQDAHDLLGDEFEDYLGRVSFWIHSDTEVTLVAIIEPHDEDENVSLVKGWNFAPIRTGWTANQLNELDSDCKFQRLYGWDENDQQWFWMSETHEFPANDADEGFVARVNKACSIPGPDDGLAPPPLPRG